MNKWFKNNEITSTTAVLYTSDITPVRSSITPALTEIRTAYIPSDYRVIRALL